MAFTASSFRVTEEDWLSETDLSGPHFFFWMFLLLLKELIIISLFVITAAGVVPCGIRKKEAPYIVLSAVYILRLVLWYQQKYSEKSENIIGLDSYILDSFSYLNPI